QYLIFSVTFGLLGINLMLIALIVAGTTIPIDQSVPSQASTTSIPIRSEFRMEHAGENIKQADSEDGNGYWKIEHFQEYEYRYDQHGKLLEKRPTHNMNHIRYWISSN